MNSKTIKLLSLLTAMLMTICVMTSCGSDEAETGKNADSAAQVQATDEGGKAPENDEAAQPPAAEEIPIESEDDAPAKSEETSKAEDTAPAKSDEAASSEPQGKYSNMETYEKDGVEYGKTEDGTEVAISGENMQKLIEEYQKVQGSGSETEQELLDQLQVILDNAEQMQEN